MASNSGISYQSSGSFVSDRGAAGVEEVVDAADEAGSLGRVSQAHLVDQLHNHQLQNVAEILDLENNKNNIVNQIKYLTYLKCTSDSVLFSTE
jgi:hypothetical protein